MRRKDREVTDGRKIDGIIAACDCMRLGFCDDGEAYIVPLNFGFEEREGRRYFYFHGAGEGRKLELIRKTGRASFELDRGHELIEGKTACSYSMKYQSVMGTGRIYLLEDAAEKRRAFSLIMAHYAGQQPWEFPEAMLKAVSVFCLEAESLSCKEHL